MNQNILDGSIKNKSRSKILAVFIQTLKNEILQAILILTITSLLFFSTPLQQYNDSYYAATNTNLTQWSLTAVTGNTGPVNRIISDTFEANIPWSVYNKDSLGKGEIPLWNPYNAAGAPHLGNLQSAVFSPFMFPFYVFNVKLALIISAFLKLFAIGFFTYLFLKQIKLRHEAALIGAISFMYSGFSIVWLGFTVSSALFILPAGLYFSERILNKALFNQPQKYYWSVVGLGVSLGCGVLAAHPETLYFSMLIIAAYILFRFYIYWSQNRFSRSGLFRIVRLSGQFILAGLIGLGLSLFQLTTFLEYLLNSSTLSDRASSIPYGPIGVSQLSLMFFPNIMGNPTLPFQIIANSYNYNITLGQYSGGLVLLLAILAILFTWKNSYSRFFIGFAFAWVLYAYNLVDMGYWYSYLPGSSNLLVNRSQFLELFIISVLAAIFVNQLIEKKTTISLRKQLLISAVVGILLLVQSLRSGQLLVQSASNVMLQPAQYKDFIGGHIWRIGLIYGLGLLLILAIPFLKNILIIKGLVLVLVFAIFFQTGFVLKDYNPTTPNETFYPETKNVQGLQKIVGNKTFAVLNQDTILPSTNLMYKLHILSSYDSLWVKNIDDLLKAFFNTSIALERLFNAASFEGLKLFGVDYILASNPDPFFNLEGTLAPVLKTSTKRELLGEILPGSGVTQTFIARQNNLQTIKLALTSNKRTNKCNLTLELTDIEAAKPVATSNVICTAIRNEYIYSFSFPPLSNSLNRSYSLSITSSDASENNAVSIYYRPDLKYPDGKLNFANKNVSGGLEFDLYTAGAKSFKLVGTLDPFNVWKVEDSPSRYYTVSNVRFASSDAEAFKLVQSATFDPTKEVIINSNSATALQSTNPAATVGNVEILEEANSRVRLKVQRSEPGYLVINTANYPGWHAYVNGKEQTLLKANYAFFGLEVGSGESVVELKYDPDSFKYGMYITIATILIIAGVGIWRKFFRKLT